MSDHLEHHVGHTNRRDPYQTSTLLDEPEDLRNEVKALGDNELPYRFAKDTEANSTSRRDEEGVPSAYRSGENGHLHPGNFEQHRRR